MNPSSHTTPSARPAPRRRPSLLAATLLVAVAAGALLPAPARAQDYSAARKFGRGLAGVTVGFLEIPGNVVQETRRHGPLSGITLGLVLGLGRFVTRELVGAYELLSAPFAVPGGFTPILEPEFPWQYFDGEARVGRIEAELREIPGATVSERGNGLVLTFSDELLFPVASSKLSPGARASLDRLARVLREQPRVTVTVTGHTDDTGSAETNRRLSEQRAAAVARHLTAQGLDPARILTQGMGAADPVASNDTAAGRRRNRRVEVELR